jgi:hypothetical protein
MPNPPIYIPIQPPDQGGEGGGTPEVSPPIYYPVYIDNTLPGVVRKRILDALTGNLPPEPEQPEPVEPNVT